MLYIPIKYLIEFNKTGFPKPELDQKIIKVNNSENSIKYLVK